MIGNDVAKSDMRFLLKCFLLSLISGLVGLLPILAQTQLIPYRKGNLWGFANSKGEILIDCQYEAVRLFLQDLAKVKKNGKWGLIDTEGKLFLDYQYDIIYAASTQGRVIVARGGDPSGHGGRWGFVPQYRSGQRIDLEYDLIRECGASGLLAIQEAGKWGAVNQFNQVIIIPQYEVESIHKHRLESLQALPEVRTSKPSGREYEKLRFSDNLARVSKNNLWGFVNTAGNEVIPTVYEFVGKFSENLVAAIGRDAQNNWSLGFLNAQGDTVIPFQYEVITPYYRATKFSEGLAAVAQQGKWAYINPQNQLKIPFQYAEAKAFRKKRAFVRLNLSDLAAPEWAIITPEGEEVCRLPKGDYPIEEGFEQDFARIQSAQGFQYFIDKMGQVVGQKDRYALIFPFAKTDLYDKTPLARVVIRRDSALFTGFINEKGEEFIAPRYDYEEKAAFRHPFARGWTSASYQGKWGVINARGKVVIDFEFEEIRLPYRFHHQQFFAEGTLAVKQHGYWGFINYRGKWLIRPQYTDAYNFSEGIARVKYGDKWGYIDRKGKHFFEE